MPVSFMPRQRDDEKNKALMAALQAILQGMQMRTQKGQFTAEQERLAKQFETREARYAEESEYKRDQTAAQKAEADEFNEMIASLTASQGKPEYTTIPGMAAPIPTGGEIGWRQLAGGYASGGETAAAERIARAGVSGERAEAAATKSAERDAEIMAASNKLWMNAGEKAGVDMSILEGIAVSGPDAVDISGVMKGAIQKTGGDAAVDYRPVWRTIKRQQYPDATPAEIDQMVAGLRDQNPGASGSAALARGPGDADVGVGDRMKMVDAYMELKNRLSSEDLDPQARSVLEFNMRAIEEALGGSVEAPAAGDVGPQQPGDRISMADIGRTIMKPGMAAAGALDKFMTAVNPELALPPEDRPAVKEGVAKFIDENPGIIPRPAPGAGPVDAEEAQRIIDEIAKAFIQTGKSDPTSAEIWELLVKYRGRKRQYGSQLEP